MTFRRFEIATMAATGLCAAVIAGGLLWPHTLPPMEPARMLDAAPRPAPNLPDSGERFLFSGGDGASGAALPQDAPELTGIVGRPPHDAVAMIRTAAGATKAIAPGESYGGWRLEAVSAEAALFSRGLLQIRVPMPAGEAE